LSQKKRILKVNISFTLGLINETYFSITYLNSNFSPKIIDTVTKVFINNVFDKDYNSLVGCIHNSLLEFEAFKVEYGYVKQEAKKILKALFVIYEFLDRGMKGFLTGDISYHLISQSQFVFEKYLKLLKPFDEDFIRKGIDPFDFYEAYFKIDQKYFEVNSSKNLVYDLAKQAENDPMINIDLKYHVNLKRINFNTSYTKLTGLRDPGMEIEKIKKNVEDIINNLYNDIERFCFVNPLHTPFHGIPFPSKENNHNLFRRQLVIEQGSFDDANNEYLKLLESLNELGKLDNLAINQKLIQKWNKMLILTVADTQKTLLASKINKRDSYLEFLVSLPSRSVSIISLIYLIRKIIENTTGRDFKKDECEYEFLEVNGEDGIEIKIPLLTFAQNLGHLLILELKNTKLADTFKDKDAKLYVKSLAENIVSYEVSKEDKIKLGQFVTHLMIKSLTFLPSKAMINQQHINILEVINRRIDKNKSQNFIKFNSVFLLEYYQELHRRFALETHIRKSLPMIYKPLPWKSAKIGSYYLRQSPFVKVLPEHYEANILFDTNNISNISTVLDKLASIKWRVNKKILDVMEYIWANGGGKAMIPKKYNDRIITKELIRHAKTFKEKTILLREAQNNREAHSLRCDFSIKMKVANEFKNINEFYYPHNLDYRGRAYPISPHLNHMGSDVNRGLLEFAEGKPLGKDGLPWLKVILN
jgi:hypothetical protein